MVGMNLQWKMNNFSIHFVQISGLVQVRYAKNISE